jgi:putative Mn2+ efflux pump MntP
MKRGKTLLIAGTFGFFQGLMPLLGWVCVRTVVHYFRAFEKCIPWIALILLCFIGGKMLLDSFKKCDCEESCSCKTLGWGTIFLQGIATSIDALSVGFTIADYGVLQAIVAALIITTVTFGLCLLGLFLGKKYGTKIGEKATLLGGVILILIGIEIFVLGII